MKLTYNFNITNYYIPTPKVKENTYKVNKITKGRKKKETNNGDIRQTDTKSRFA